MGLFSAVFVCIPMIFHKFSVLLAKDCKNKKKDENNTIKEWHWEKPFFKS